MTASFLIAMRQQSRLELLSWEKYDYKSGNNVIQAFSQHIITDLRKEAQKIDLCKLETLLNTNPNLLVIWKELFIYVYGKYATNFRVFTDHSSSQHILPVCEG